MPTQPTDNQALQEILAATNGGGGGLQLDPRHQPGAVAPGHVDVNSLPDMVANNPSAYAELIGYQYRDPLSYYDTFSGGPARGLGASNGLVLYTTPNKKEGATAAVLADIANRQQQKRFEEVLSGRKPKPSSNLGTLGDLGGGAANYIRDLVKAAYIGGQAGARAQRPGLGGVGTTTPAAESGGGRMGGGGGPSAAGGGVDWGAILGAVLGSQR